MSESGFIRNNINQFAFAYRIVDITLIQLVLVFCCVFYRQEFSSLYVIVALIGSMGFLFFAELFVLYRSWRSGYVKEMLFYALTSWVLTMLPVFAYLFFSKQAEEVSRVALGLWAISTGFVLCFWRVLFKEFLTSIRKRGYNTRSVAILGLSSNGLKLANEIDASPHMGFRLTGVYDERKKERLDESRQTLWKGSLPSCVSDAKKKKIDILFICLPLTARSRIEHILAELGDTTVDVHIIPDMLLFNMLHSRTCNVGDMQTISIYDTPMRGGYSIMKRMEDVFLSLSILTIISIPMVLIALAIKLTSRGPIIFKQDRYGMDGKKILVWKFRSMRVMDNGAVVKQATKGDPRITPLGAFLRKTSLDELPQFFNVLQGRMSVVGPRPHAVSHNEEYRKKINGYMLRHKMKPGITGWAQVNGWRGETDTDEKMAMRIQYDLDYIRNWSIWMDFKIVIFTLFKGFVGKNVY